MILTAGVAAGLGIVRAIDPTLTPRDIWNALAEPAEGWSFRYGFAIVAELGVVLGLPLMAAWTPACLLLHLIRPRPGWRRLRRRPVFIACLLPSVAAALTATVAVGLAWPSIWVPGGPSPQANEETCLLGGFLAGTGVLWAWAAMWVCGVWHARPTWVDRLGRLTGVGWVTIGAISAAYIVLTI
jgi:hypothetical protein